MVVRPVEFHSDFDRTDHHFVVFVRIDHTMPPDGTCHAPIFPARRLDLGTLWQHLVL